MRDALPRSSSQSCRRAQGRWVSEPPCVPGSWSGWIPGLAGSQAQACLAYLASARPPTARIEPGRLVACMRHAPAPSAPAPAPGPGIQADRTCGIWLNVNPTSTRPRASLGILPSDPAISTCINLRPSNSYPPASGTDSRLAASTRIRALAHTAVLRPMRLRGLLVCERTPCCAQRTCTVQSYANADMWTGADDSSARRPAAIPFGPLPPASCARCDARLAHNMTKMSSSRKRRHRPTPSSLRPWPFSQSGVLSRRPHPSLALGPLRLALCYRNPTSSTANPLISTVSVRLSPLLPTHSNASPPPPPHARNGRSRAAPTMSYCSA